MYIALNGRRSALFRCGNARSSRTPTVTENGSDCHLNNIYIHDQQAKSNNIFARPNTAQMILSLFILDTETAFNVPHARHEVHMDVYVRSMLDEVTM